jgi:hypothetical protein
MKANPSMEAPTHDQRKEAAIEAAVMLLASGRPVPTVTAEMRKREIPAEEYEEIWSEIEARAKKRIVAQRRRTRMTGWCWLGLGAAVLIGFFWVLIVHHFVSVPLLLGFGPLGYGIHLLRLPDGGEPAIEPPQFFGKMS